MINLKEEIKLMDGDGDATLTLSLYQLECVQAKVEELERVNENHCKAHLMSIDKIDELETALAVCDVPVKRLTAKVEELQKWKDYVMENNEFYHSQEVSDADT